TVRAIMEVAGATDVLSKSLGSNSAINVVRATFGAVAQLMDARKLARERGKALVDMWG
ncbi:30S ribosomal protein S5, partial [Treponema pallidum]